MISKLSVEKFQTLTKGNLENVVGGNKTGGGQATLDERHESWVDDKGNIQYKSSYLVRNYFGDELQDGVMCFSWEGEAFWWWSEY